MERQHDRSETNGQGRGRPLQVVVARACSAMLALQALHRYHQSDTHLLHGVWKHETTEREARSIFLRREGVLFRDKNHAFGSERQNSVH